MLARIHAIPVDKLGFHVERESVSDAAQEPTTPKRAPINMRLALTGAALLSGKPIKHAAMGSGYAESTAANPARNGITVDRCLAELAKVNPDAVPAKLLGLGRTRLLEHLQSTDGTKMRTGEVARLVDVMERAYGAGQPLDALDEGRDIPDRETFLGMLAHMREARIGPRVATGGVLSPPIDAIEVTETAEQRGESAEPQGATVPMSDNGQYDTCDSEGESVEPRDSKPLREG